jgi:hypothetical protein
VHESGIVWAKYGGCGEGREYGTGVKRQQSEGMHGTLCFGSGLSGPAFGTIMPEQPTNLPGGDVVTDFVQPGAAA